MIELSPQNLSYTRRTFVKPGGDPDTCQLIIVGEQPGKMDVIDGRPFAGPSGKELTGILSRVGIANAQCYKTNVIKDLDNPISHYFAYNPKSKQVDVTDDGRYYITKLQEELQAIPTTAVVLAVGNIAMYALTGQWGITKRRGSVYKNHLSEHWVVPCIHPSTVLRGEEENRLLIQWDIIKAVKLQRGQYELPNFTLHIRPSFALCVEWLRRMWQSGIHGKHIAFDIEVKNEEVCSIAFADNTHEALCIPFTYEGGLYFSPPQEVQIMQLIAGILENEAIPKLAQNAIFDTHFMLRKYGIKTKNCDDTYVAQKMLMGDYPAGLDFIASIYSNVPYYKDEGKAWFAGKNNSFDSLWEYNCKDVLVCTQAFPQQREDLIAQGNLEIYYEQNRLIEPLTYLMEHGIRCDVEGMVAEAMKHKEVIVELQSQLNELAGKELNANSAKQLKAYFYEEKGMTPYKKKGKGGVTCDTDAMKRLARKGFKEASIIKDIRGNKKLLSTYLPLDEEGNPVKIDKDGRIRCSYNPVGTRYSRISSSTNIFGTGMNMQNWPHHLKKYLLPDKGYGYYSFDLSNAENRIVAYVGDVSEMIEVFVKGLDAHRKTASLIFDKPYEEISDEPGSCSLGDGTKSERDFGKRSNHGLNYDLGYKAFSFIYELPEPQGRYIVDKYHRSYPGIRKVFHKRVQNEIMRSRTVTNLLGRKTLFHKPISDELYKAAYSGIPQGTVGDIMNKYGVNYVYYSGEFPEVELLEQVHDSLGMQIPFPTEANGITWERHAEILLKIKASLEVPLEANGRTFTIPADLTFGTTFYKKDCLELKGGKFPTEISTLAAKLQEMWGQLNERKHK